MFMVADDGRVDEWARRARRATRLVLVEPADASSNDAPSS